MTQTFVARIQRGKNKNTAGIVVPAAVVEALGEGRRPPVKVTLNGYTYRSTVASMGGRFMIPLSAENRQAARLEGDPELEIRLELDTEPRNTPPPDDLKAALLKARLLDAFEKAAPSRRKEFVRQVEDAKTPETRKRRISKVLTALA
jgi:hypothetical protein